MELTNLSTLTRGEAAIAALMELCEHCTDGPIRDTLEAIRQEEGTDFAGAVQIFLAEWYAEKFNKNLV